MPPEVAAAFLKPEPLPRGAIHGLGHRVIDDLVQSTGGQLSIDAAPKRGTTLRIDWPISPGGTKVVERRAAVRSTTGITSPDRTSKRIPREGAALSC
jgi:hypothetical protein